MYQNSSSNNNKHEEKVSQKQSNSDISNKLIGFSFETFLENKNLPKKC